MVAFDWFWRAMGAKSVQNQKRSREIVADAASQGLSCAEMSDSDLVRQARELTQDGKLRNPGLFLAVLAEASHRTLGMKPFDVQSQAVLRVLEGDVIHMATGEGKTLVGAMAATGFALMGKRVHMITVNDYLAGRDASWMSPLVTFFHLRVSAVQSHLSPAERRDAYACDVVYSPVNEIGFDLLRDQQVTRRSDQVQLPADVALIDEADSVLVDEALVPLVLAGSQPGESPAGRITDIVRTLAEDIDYETDSDRRNVFLTDKGADKIAARLGIPSLYSDEHIGTTLVQVNLALHAKALLLRDVHYLVRDGKVQLIDASRGRVADLQRWPDGLQAAVEAKEGLAVTDGGRILDTMTIQELMKRYPMVCGMTGTAVEATDQLRQFYNLRVSVIDRAQPLRRVDEPDRIYDTLVHKNRAIVNEILRIHETGQPILVGTHDVAESEALAHALDGIPLNILNAKNDEEEARVIAEAGEYRGVTISTQMAGRGTDIRLGGADERDHDRVVATGGLAVIGTGRYRTERLDNQLRGRAGRQGDPGRSVFFVSLEDDMVQAAGSPLNVTGADDDGFIEKKRVHDYIDHCQRVTDGQLLEIHAQTWKYNQLMADQHAIINKRRDTLLDSDKAWVELSEKAPERAANLTGIPQEVLEQAARDIMLYHLDMEWSEHLITMDSVRESIHLRAIARETPIDEFHKISIAEFKELAQRAVEKAVATFCEVQIDNEGAHLSEAGRVRPSATWTYMVSDNPLSGGGNSVMTGIGNIFR